jgi:hypothetical protein
MAGRTSGVRARVPRERKPVVYIICEGKKTEVNYFKGFHKRDSLIDIIPVTSQYKDALHLVKNAKTAIGDKEFRPEDRDQLWCVFDRDENTDAKLREAEQLAKKHGYNIAFSNPAFELWFLLHFADYRAYIDDADKLIGLLQEAGRLPNYSKSGDYYNVLLPKLEQAVDRANALQKFHTENGKQLLEREANPCTTVDRLVELLRSRATE